MVAQGAAWPAARRAELGEHISPECEFCKTGAEGTLQHQCWECPVVLAGIGPDRVKTQHLELAAMKPNMKRPEAMRSWARGVPPPNCVAFWCRGILPSPGTGVLENVLQPPANATVRNGIARGCSCRITKEFGLHLTAGSDGSGGKYASDVRLRSVGWSWTLLAPSGEELGHSYGGIAGRSGQTVPRAELTAAIDFLRVAEIDEEVSVDLFIDNSYTVNLLHTIISGWRPSASTVHGDLISELLDDERGLQNLVNGKVNILKVKSHLTWKQTEPTGTPWIGWEANRVADQLADKGAVLAEYSPGDINLVQLLSSNAEDVVKRLVAVGRYVVANRQVPIKTPKVPNASLRERLSEAARTNQHELKFMAQGGSGGVVCQTCQQHSRLRAAMAWVTSRCPGPGTAQGHRMDTVHGLPFCLRCGRYSRAGLRGACAGHATGFGLRMLSRFNATPPMPPYGYKAWPDGTPAEAERRAHRALSSRHVHGLAAPSHKRKGTPGSRGGKAVKARTRRMPINLLGASPCTGAGCPPEEGPSEAACRLAALRRRVLARDPAGPPANAVPPVLVPQAASPYSVSDTARCEPAGKSGEGGVRGAGPPVVLLPGATSGQDGPRTPPEPEGLQSFFAGLIAGAAVTAARQADQDRTEALFNRSASLAGRPRATSAPAVKRGRVHEQSPIAQPSQAEARFIALRARIRAKEAAARVPSQPCPDSGQDKAAEPAQPT